MDFFIETCLTNYSYSSMLMNVVYIRHKYMYTLYSGQSQNSCGAKKKKLLRRGEGQREDTQNVFSHAMLGIKLMPIICF
jgi:hypothetical protein